MKKLARIGGRRAAVMSAVAAAGVGLMLFGERSALGAGISSSILQDAEPPAGALRYHTALLRRPAPGYLFDRFCDAWISERSAESLGDFLRERAEGGGESDQLLLAFFLRREGMLVEAIEQFRETLESHPGSAGVWYEKARVEAATLDFDTALTDLARAGELAGGDDELSEQVAKLRGQLLVRTGKRDEAAALWASLIEANPDDEILREDLVDLQIEAGLFDEALATLGALIEASGDPRDAVARRMWAADIHLRANERDKAVGVYVEALNDVGQGSWLERELLARIDMAYRRGDDLTGLREKLDELAGALGDRVEVSKRRARLLGELGDTEGAVTAWRDVIARTPGERGNRVELARFLADNGRSEDALEQLQVLVSEAPDDEALKFRLAELRAQTGDEEGAIADMRAFVEEAGGDPGRALRAARLLERVGQDTAALEMVREMAGAAPDDVSRREALAEFTFRLGEETEAVEIWRAMAADAGESGDVLRAARALISRGERDAGFDVLRRRGDAFGDDPRFLGALTEAAITVKAFDEASDAALRWVNAAQSVEMAERAVLAAARAAVSAGSAEALADRLDGMGAGRTEGETCLLAELRQQLGEPFRADEVLAGAEASERVLRQRARLLRERGEFVKAAEVIESLIERLAAAPTSYIRQLVDLRSRSGELTAAMEAVERWKAISPGSVSPWLRGAELLLARGDREGAIEWMERARGQHPEDVSVVSRLAALYGEAGRDRDAERIYWDLFEATDSTAGRIRWVGELARLAEWSGGRDRLIETLDSRRRTDRQSAEPYLVLAEAHRVLDDSEARRGALLEAARHEPDNVDLLLQIASVEEDAGDLDRALATLRRASAADTSGRVRGRIAQLMVLSGRLNEAVSEVNDPSSRPLDADSVLRIANAMLTMGEWEVAASFLEPHVERVGDYRVGYLHAVCLEESGRGDEARPAFLRVLETAQERAGGASPSTNPMSGRFRQWLAGVMPESSIRLMEMLEVSELAYRHAGSRRYYGWGGFGGGRGRVVHLPGSLEECKALTVAHVMRLADEMDEASRDLLASDLERRGVEMAAVLMDLGGLDGFEAMNSPELMEAHADEPGVLALIVYSSAVGQSPTNEEMSRRAAEEFGESWPDLAALARLSLLRVADSDDTEAAWAALRSSLETIEKPSPLTMWTTTSALGAMGMGVSLEPEQREWLTGRLVAWLSEADRSSMLYDQSFMMVVSAVAQTENPDLLAELISSEVRAHRARPKGSASQMGRMFGIMGMGQTPVARLSLPPAELRSLPQTVLSMLSPDGSMFFGSASIDQETLAQAVASADDPLLDAVVAVVGRDAEAFESKIGPLLEKEAPDLDAYLLAAAWSGENGVPDRAVDLLQKATYLPMTRSTRERLDGAIVAYSLETSLEAGILEAAQRSALRLLYTSKDQQTRMALAGVLGQLGLDEEAEREQDRLAAGGGGMAPSLRTIVGGARGGGGGASAIERIADAMDDGRREPAVRLALRELRGHADTLLSGQRGMRADSEATRLMHTMRQVGIFDDVVGSADPGESASAVRLAQYGAVLELLDRDDEAEGVYERAFADRANSPAGPALMRLRLERGDVEGAADVLARVPERNLTSVGQFLSMFSYSSRQDEGTAFASAEMMAVYLEKGHEATPNVVMLASQALSEMLGVYYLSDAALPPLYAIDPEVPESLEAKQARRFEVHDRLVSAMLASPAMAEMAFPSRMAMAELRGEADAGLAELAESILKNSDDGANTPQAQSMMVRAIASSMFGGRVWVNDQVEQVEPCSAIHYLADHAASAGDEALVEDVAGALRDAGRRDDAEQFETLYTMYGADGARFAELVDESLKSRGGANPMMGNTPLDSAVVVLRRRDLDPTVIQAPLLEHVERNTRSPMLMQMVGSMSVYSALVAERSGPERAEAYLESLITALLGPPDRRERELERLARGGGQGFGGGDPRLQLLVMQMRSFFTEPATIWIAARHMALLEDAMDGSPLFDGVMSEAVSEHLDRALQIGDGDSADSAAEIIGFLEGSPLVADADEFRTIRLEHSEQGSAFNQIGAVLGMDEHAEKITVGPEAEVNRAVVEWLESKEPPTVGTVLLASALRRESPRERFEALAAHVGDPASLDGRAAEHVLAALGARAGAPEGLSESASALAAHLFDVGAASLDERIAEFLDTRVNMSSMHVWEFTSTATGVIADTASARRGEDLDKVIEHALRELRRSGGFSGRGQSAPSTLISGLLSHEPMSAAVIAVANRLAQEDGPESMSYAWGVRRAVRTLTENVDYDEAVSDPRVSGSDAEAASDREVRLRRVLLDLRAATGDEQGVLGVVVALLYSISDASDGAEVGGLVDWADERAREDPVAFWDDIRGAARIRRAYQDSEAWSEDDGPAVAEYLRSVLERDAPPAVRVWVFGQFMRWVDDTAIDVEDAGRAGMVLAADVIREHPDQVRENWVRPMLQIQADSSSGEGWPDAATLIDALINASVRVRSSRGQSYLLSSATPFRHSQPFRAQARGSGLLALELATRAGADDRVKRLVSTPSTGLGRSPLAWASLVVNGKPELAARAIRSEWARAQPEFVEGVAFTPELAERLPGLIELIEGEELRLFAEASLAVFPTEREAPEGAEVESDEDAPDEALAARLGPLVERFNAMEFENRRLRERTLMMLTAAPAGIDALGESLAEYAERPPDITPGRSGAIDQFGDPSVELFVAAIRAELRRGALDGFKDAIEHYAQRSDDWYTWRFVGTLVRYFVSDCLGELDGVPPDRVEPMLAVIETMFEGPIMRSALIDGQSHVEQLLAAHGALAIATVRVDRYASLIEDLRGEDGERDEEFTFSLDIDEVLGVMEVLASDDASADGASFERFRAAFTHPVVIESIVDHDYLFLRAFERELITAQDLADHGLEMAQTIGDNAWMGLGFAANEAELGELSDEAWRRAMASREDVSEELQYLRHMIESERYALALETLASIEPTSLEESATHRRLSRRAQAGLEKQAESQAEEGDEK